MSSITTAIDFALRGADTNDLDNLRLRVEEALYRREEVIAEQIVTEVVRQFGVPDSEVRVRLAETGMAVRGAGLDEDDEDEDTPARKESDGGVSSAVAGLIRAITARLA